LALGDVQFQDLFLLLKAGDPTGPYATLEEARAAGAVPLAYGAFVNNVVTFFLVAFAVFLIIKAFNRLRRKESEQPTTRNCPHCLSTIPLKATRCAHCTAELAPAA
jgi:large conductance mechanosensitive channel